MSNSIFGIKMIQASDMPVSFFNHYNTPKEEFSPKFVDSDSSINASKSTFSNTYDQGKKVFINEQALPLFSLIANAAVKPTSKFSINDTTQCLRGNSFVFRDTSTTPSGTLNYSWNFGDGGTSSTKNPSHVYASAGTYNVRLIVTIANGGTSDTATIPVLVYPNSNANFVLNDTLQCYNKNNFIFSHSAAPGVSLTYTWDFGDNKFSSLANPSHNYIQSGSYNVKLKIVSQYGCIDSSKLNVVLYGDIKSSFSIDDSGQCVDGNLFTFKNNSTFGDNILTSIWNFGDDTVTTVFDPVHTYAKSGVYSVTLVSSNSAGCYDTSVVSLSVYPRPKSSFKVNKDEQQLTNNNFVFTNLTSIDIGTHSSNWNFGDFTTSDSSSPIHTYADVGTYTVTLISTSDQGCVDTFASPVLVTTAVSAKFTSTETVSCINENLFLFTNESTVKGGKVKYYWDFGDSTNTVDANPAHVYKQPGIYKVTLIATGSYGGIDSSSLILTVAPIPIVGFGINDSIQCLKGNKFAFFNTSSIEFGEMQYLWNFGDSSESTVRNIKYSYANPGDYTVKLTVTSEYGCKDSIEQTLSVKPSPVGIKYDSVLTRENFDTKLVARSYDSATYLWNPTLYLNDPVSKEVIFNGSKPIRYTIKITDIYNCTFVDTVNILFFKNINILVPKAFTPNSDNLNDVLRPNLLGIKELQTFSIYNRWGVLLFNTSDPKKGWDGTYKGVLQPMDTYTWVAKGIDIDGKVVNKSGNFILLK